MPPLLKRLRTRASERIDRVAVGTQPPAGSEPAELPDGNTSARERGKMRRRLRQLAKLRRALLLDLGALTFEMHRQQRHDPDLIGRKAKDAIAVDAEARGLAQALDEDLPIEDVLATGIARSCASCGAIQAADARYCSGCGTAIGERSGASSSQPSNGDADRIPPPWAKELG